MITLQKIAGLEHWVQLLVFSQLYAGDIC